MIIKKVDQPFDDDFGNCQGNFIYIVHTETLPQEFKKKTLSVTL